MYAVGSVVHSLLRAGACRLLSRMYSDRKRETKRQPTTLPIQIDFSRRDPILRGLNDFLPRLMPTCECSSTFVKKNRQQQHQNRSVLKNVDLNPLRPRLLSVYFVDTAAQQSVLLWWVPRPANPKSRPSLGCGVESPFAVPCLVYLPILWSQPLSLVYIPLAGVFLLVVATTLGCRRRNLSAYPISFHASHVPSLFFW